MRALFSRLLVAALLAVSTLAAVVAPAAAHESSFPDVEADHATDVHEAIEWAYATGLTVGYGDGTFKPDVPLVRRHAVVFTERLYDDILKADSSPRFNRGDMMRVLWAIAGRPDVDYAVEFSDIDSSHPAFAAVRWAASTRVTVGYTDGTFRPQTPLSRPHAVTFMERYYDEILQADESENFTRGDMMSILYAINNETDPEDTSTVDVSGWPLMERCSNRLDDNGDEFWRYTGKVTELHGTPIDPQVAAPVGPSPVTRFNISGPEISEAQCDSLKAWWQSVVETEIAAHANGERPCEWGGPLNAAYSIHNDEYRELQPVITGCWPEVFAPPNAVPDADIDAEWRRQNSARAHRSLPPNTEPVARALYTCYVDALEGPPEESSFDQWPTLMTCGFLMSRYGPAVRRLGVMSECAAEQFAGAVAEYKQHGYVRTIYSDPYQLRPLEMYSGEWSWVNCQTVADRVINDDSIVGYVARCRAAVAAGVTDVTYLYADTAGVSVDEIAEIVESMFCTSAASKSSTIEDPALEQRWIDIFHPGVKAEDSFRVQWMPYQGSVCYEAALIVQAMASMVGRTELITGC